MLAATTPGGLKMELVLTNPNLPLPDGRLCQKEDLAIQWQRILDSSRLALLDRLTLHNYSHEPVSLTLSLRFRAEFEDVFAVRGMAVKKRGTLHPPDWNDGSLTFGYDGTDGLDRRLTIHFDPPPRQVDGTTARFRVTLAPRESQQFQVSLFVVEQAEKGQAPPRSEAFPDFRQMSHSREQSAREKLDRQTMIHSNSRLLNEALERSLRDLHILRGSLYGQAYFAAGVPWYVALFGRDSLIAALQSLAYQPEAAEHTLRLLARLQGKKVDEWRDEAPGKILHELRVGEMANTNQIPQTPYYGSIDSTPLFLILLCRHAAWTGALDLFHELQDAVVAALTWMEKYGDPNGQGYLAYQVKSKQGLGNQGWKDSGDSIVNADGSLAKPPIALAEVQGYAYLARVGLADLYHRAGQSGRAQRLQEEADDLRRRFNRDFWMEDKGISALALQEGQKPADVVASNAGQVLWSGIADIDKAKRTAERLMREDVFNGWGIRTLSGKEKRFNPIGYHLGTVWPHDNSIIAAGFRLYGCDDAAHRVFAGLFDAAASFYGYRLPEVFSGFCRDRYHVPVHYPVACHPQAWAAGALPFMLTTLLGLTPEAFEHRLRIVRPMLPDGVRWLEVHQLRVGQGQFDLRFERAAGRIEVKILDVEGQLEVVVENEGESE
jgi:glycogen debranching enzyme